MLCFSFVGVNSLIKLFAMVAVAIGVLLSPLELRPLRQMRPHVFVITGILVVLYIIVNSQTFDPILVVNLAGALFFIIHTLDIISTKMKVANITTPTISNVTGKITAAQTSIIAITSILIITFFSTSSPLYIYNFWDDTNIYFTVGRGMTRGLIPYKDVFEQKGPYLHLIYAISALISYNTFFGVYLWEIIACFTFNIFAWKSVSLFYKPSKYSLVLIPLLSTLLYLVIPFHFGGSAEEFCFPLLAAIFYLACRAEVNDRLPNKKETFVIGILTGIIIMIKYTACGFIFGYILFILYRVISSKQLSRLFGLIMMFLGGIVVACIPVIIYFAANNALSDMFTIYFYNNMFAYSDSVTSVSTMLYNVGEFMRLSNYTFYSAILSIFALAGLKGNIRKMYLLMFAFMALVIYAPGRFIYYYIMILTSLSIPGFLLVSFLWDSFCTSLKRIKIRPDVIACVIAITLFGISFASQRNYELLKKTPDDIPQIVLGDIVKQTPDAKLLTYDVMDAGFFLYSDALPPTWYYCHTNTTKSNPEFREMQLREIADHKFDYIIAFSGDYNWDGYEVIASADFHAEDIQITITDQRDYTYYLYAKVQ